MLRCSTKVVENRKNATHTKDSRSDSANTAWIDKRSTDIILECQQHGQIQYEYSLAYPLLPTLTEEQKLSTTDSQSQKKLKKRKKRGMRTFALTFLLRQNNRAVSLKVNQTLRNNSTINKLRYASNWLAWPPPSQYYSQCLTSSTPVLFAGAQGATKRIRRKKKIRINFCHHTLLPHSFSERSRLPEQRKAHHFAIQSQSSKLAKQIYILIMDTRNTPQINPYLNFSFSLRSRSLTNIVPFLFQFFLHFLSILGYSIQKRPTIVLIDTCVVTIVPGNQILFTFDDVVELSVLVHGGWCAV